MNKPIFIIGAGGHAKVLLESLRQNPDVEIRGFLEIDNQLIGKSILTMPIYEQAAIFKKYTPKDIILVNGIGSISIPTLRGAQFKKLKKSGYQFFSVFHPTAYYSTDVVFGEGSQILARSTILTGSKIGVDTIVNTAASIDHDCNIGNHVHIAPGVVLSGSVTIDDFCHIGTGAKIIQGIHIGKNSLVGAGAVVISDLPPNSCVAGVPARIMQ